MPRSNSTSSNIIPQSYLLSQIIVSFLLATPAVLSNVILLFTVYRSHLWRTPVNLLVINLSVSDFLSGMIPGFGSLYYDINLLIDQTRENLSGLRLALIISAVVTNIVASCTIAAMSFDRFFAVSSPFQYKRRVTRTKIKVFIAIIWIYAVLFSSLAMGVSTSAFVLLYCHVHVSFPLLVFPVVYWKTHRALQCHNNQVRNISSAMNGRDLERMAFAHRNRERKMISAFLIVLVLFYATFAPQYITQNILVFHPSTLELESFKFFLYASNKFLLVNCSLNPFIYAWRIPKYRKAFKEVFKGCRCRKRLRYIVADTYMMTIRTTN